MADQIPSEKAYTLSILKVGFEHVAVVKSPVASNKVSSLWARFVPPIFWTPFNTAEVVFHSPTILKFERFSFETLSESSEQDKNKNEIN